jgi:hypothetical protein
MTGNVVRTVAALLAFGCLSVAATTSSSRRLHSAHGMVRDT